MNTNKQNNIQEINEGEFQEKVINASNTCLILVDFWAPWCGPCKQLTPILEKIVNNANEKVVLVKINIDENQQIAGQLNIQSIPAVFAFKNGQPVDAFQGVIPEKKVRAYPADKDLSFWTGPEQALDFWTCQNFHFRLNLYFLALEMIVWHNSIMTLHGFAWRSQKGHQNIKKQIFLFTNYSPTQKLPNKSQQK